MIRLNQTKSSSRPAAPPPKRGKVSTWAELSLGFTPDPRQAKLLDLEASRLAVCTGRQQGKTQAAAAKALHLDLATKPDRNHTRSLVLPNGYRFIAHRLQFLDRELIEQATIPREPQGKPIPSITELVIGVDIGKRISHSAIVVLAFSWSLERRPSQPGRQEQALYPRINLLHAESLPLGAAHFDLPARMNTILATCDAHHAPGVIELMPRRFQGRPGLLTCLRSAFDLKLIQLPIALPGFAALEQELIHFRADSHQSEHDDLVFAPALAT